MKRFAIILLVLILTACSIAPVDGMAVIKAFKAAGLEAETAYTMAPKAYGAAPLVCKGTRFLIPSLGADNGGRIFICDNQDDIASLQHYYVSLGKSSALLFSWVFVKGNVLVQINGDLAEATAHQYEAAIP